MKTIVGYASEISVAPGQAIDFMVSSEEGRDFTARIVRVIQGDTNPAGPGYQEEVVSSAIDGVYRGCRQAIHAGSYGLVPPSSLFGDLKSFTFQAMIWPTAAGRGEQVIASFWSQGAGFELFIDETGALAGRVGDGSGLVDIVSSGRPMLTRRWYLAVLSLDVEAGALRLVQAPLAPAVMIADRGEASASTTVTTIGDVARSLVFAARAAAPDASHCTLHYNGKIDSPRLYAHALAGEALSSHTASDDIVSKTPGLIGAWDFSQDIQGVTFADRSANGLVGTLRQLPARAMTGCNWRDETLAWTHAPIQFGAVHFHDDDLYDAGWEPQLRWTVPAELKSGLYALHVTTGEDEDYLPFFVRAPAAGPHAKVAFLAPTATYLSYGNEHMAVDFPHAERAHDVLPVFNAYDLFLMEHREYGNSLYDVHSDGSAVCYASRLRPLLNFKTKCQSWLGGASSSLWQINSDTHIIGWLEALGVRYDCITDEDIHFGGAGVLAPYACVITGTHPEYYSTAMWDALEGFKAQGGCLMALGGNAFHQRIAYHQTLPGVMEVRRAGCPAGEAFHSFTGEYGGGWRRLGRPPQTMAGTGFTGQGFDISSYYRRNADSYEPRAAFIFEGVEGEILGDFGLIGGGAAGIELDRADIALGTPPHALILATSENHTSIYMLSNDDMGMNVPGLDATQSAQLHADMVFFETAAGGGVFSTGSIAWAGSLSHNGYDNCISRITRNLLERFVSGERFAV